MKPQTQYTKSGRINIAYQVIGDGPLDLVYIPGWISHIDMMWENPELSQFLKELTKIARVILFDKRGTGLSDRFIELSTLEDRMDDIRAVMDAVDSARAVLFGHSEGGSVSALFAATYPERTLALITFGVFARRRQNVDYPWAPSDHERQQVYDMIEQHWGSGEMDFSSLAPSKADDKVFMEWLSRYFRSGASPSAALVLTKMNTQVDIIDILDAIEVPSLFMCRTHDIDVKVEESKFMAERIKGSKMVEFSGHDHLFWVGNTEEVLFEIIEFLTGRRPNPADIKQENRHFPIPKPAVKSIHDGQLATVVCFKLEQQFNNLAAYILAKNKLTETITRLADQYLGQPSMASLDATHALFKGPSKAVHCAIDLLRELQIEGLDIQAGIHVGECLVDKGRATGKAVLMADALASSANGNEILISTTTKNLLSGAGLDFKASDQVGIDDLDQPIQSFLVKDVMNEEDNEPPPKASKSRTKNHSFLENILEVIEKHLEDEHFSIDHLCKEIGMSARQLQRKLNSITNKTPNQMVRSVRLHKAKEFILSGHEGISEAAFRTGFSSLSYFTKCFKQEFGMTASEMSKQNVR